MSTRPRFRVSAWPEGPWWVLVAHDVDEHGNVASQARRLADAERMIRDALEGVLEHDDFEVEITQVEPPAAA